MRTLGLFGLAQFFNRPSGFIKVNFRRSL